MKDSWNRTSREVAWAAQMELELPAPCVESPLEAAPEGDVGITAGRRRIIDQPSVSEVGHGK